MFSQWRDRLRHTLGFRLATWYAVIFVTTSLALVAITYLLLDASLRQYDRETIQTMLVRFAASYARGGRDALAREIRTTQLAGDPGPLLVRTTGARQDVLFLSMPEAWQGVDLSQLDAPAPGDDPSWTTLQMGEDGPELEVASITLPGGTLFQVGK